MSAVLNSEGAASSRSEDTASSRNEKSDAIEIREGDWKAYLHFSAKFQTNPTLADRHGSLTAYKRACALAYLGRRAQLRGGVCSSRHPHIITPEFITNLEAVNKAQRHSRYPWLEALMTILAEIERIQDEISANSNVVSLVNVTK